MKIPHYIIKNHNGIYYFRCRITSRLKRYFPTNKKEIRKSLKTRLWSKAVNKARHMWVVMNNYIDDIESMDQSIDDLEKGVQLLIELDKLNDQSEATFNSINLDERIWQLSENDKLLMDKAWTTYKTISDDNSTAQVSDALREILSKLDGLDLNQQQQVKAVDDHRLVDLIDDHLNEKEDIEDSTIRAYRSHLLDFLEISELIMLDQVDVDSLRLYKKRYTQLPPNRKKVADYKSKTIPQILEMDITKTVSRDTCKKAFSTVNSFLEWLKNQKYLTDSYKTILKAPKKNKKLDESRAVFSNTDLEAIFGVDEYKIHGFRGYPFRYWVPLIALYSGMRQNEICQLHVTDIEKKENIWIFNINDDGIKKLKNQSSRRNIPIHSKLVKLGFIEYLKSRKGEIMLFGQLTKDSDDKFNRKVSRFFNDSYKGKAGLREYAGIEKFTSKGKKDFHSFRHTFINCAKQLSINPVVIKELVGHTTSDITFETYGKNYSLSVKKKAINKIVFEFQHPEKWRA